MWQKIKNMFSKNNTDNTIKKIKRNKGIKNNLKKYLAIATATGLSIAGAYKLLGEGKITEQKITDATKLLLTTNNLENNTDATNLLLTTNNLENNNEEIIKEEITNTTTTENPENNNEEISEDEEEEEEEITNTTTTENTENNNEEITEEKKEEILTLENIGMGAAGMTIAAGLAKKNFPAIRRGFKTLSKNLKTGIKENSPSAPQKNKIFFKENMYGSLPNNSIFAKELKLTLEKIEKEKEINGYPIQIVHNNKSTEIVPYYKDNKGKKKN